MRRVFVGVESGSPAQLRRYGKGQTVAQTVDALRVASMLRVPLEFGFITFDPLLTPPELAENIAFLARRAVLAEPGHGPVSDRVDLVASYLGGAALTASRVPLYRHVAYMATELEVLAYSRYAALLQRRHPDLLDGSRDPNFARHGVTYANPGVGAVAAWCRVWAEGMFTPVYQARMALRVAPSPEQVSASAALVLRHRDATFALLLALTVTLLPQTTAQLATVLPPPGLPAAALPPDAGNEEITALLRRLAIHTFGTPTSGSGPAVAVEFDPRHLGRRRAG